MPDQQIDPGHNATRDVLRIVGPIVTLVGLGFIVVGVTSFFVSFGSFGPPRYFWCAFVGMPLLFVGLVLSSCGYMGKMMRYQAGETAPVVKDTFNYMADGAREGVEMVAGAVGRGLRAGGVAGSGAMVRCHKCNALMAADAKFCSQCGQAAGKTKPCPQCRELNDPDARFCDNCGHEYT
jgi:RNA polymerase subunit RPABC4/transcription elongation factor Spt4